MKKLTFVLALMLLIVGLVFAGDPVTATLTGSATAKWGVNLNNYATGFENSASASLTIPLVAQATKEKGSVPSGYISLANFAVSIGNSGLSVTAPSVTAKLLLTDAVSLILYGAPSFSVGQAGPFMTLSDIANGESSPTQISDAVEPDLSGYTGGLTLEYAMDMATIDFKVVSHGSWEAVSTDAVYGWANSDNGDGTWSLDTSSTTAPAWHVVTAASTTAANTANNYSAGVDVTLKPVDMLTAVFKVGYGPFSAGDVALSGKLTVKPVDMLSVWGAVDGSLPNGGSFAYDAAFGAAVTTDAADLTLTGYYGSSDLDGQAVLSVKAVKNLTLSETFEAYTVLTAFDWASKTSLSYALDSGYTPYAGATYYNNGSAAGTLQLNAGVTATKLLANTTFQVDWTSGTDVSSDLGAVVVSATVSY